MLQDLPYVRTCHCPVRFYFTKKIVSRGKVPSYMLNYSHSVRKLKKSLCLVAGKLHDFDCCFVVNELNGVHVSFSAVLWSTRVLFDFLGEQHCSLMGDRFLLSWRQTIFWHEHPELFLILFVVYYFATLLGNVDDWLCIHYFRSK